MGKLIKISMKRLKIYLKIMKKFFLN